MCLKKFSKSLFRALKGLRQVWHDENNFRIEIVIAIMVIVLMFYWQLPILEKISLISMIALVLSLEVLNTAIERIMDILKPKIHDYVGTIKDMVAAAVLIASLAALIIGLIIFYPYLF
ncbi:MAG: hypothetical protein AUJ28_02460 [Parcubacteria group bacterium CG1_02_37_51]|uniref:Diacylglycerol kinase n=2 Tax=Candidatus Komeiliibacteriota TaxID=1817908 RepID=A0A2M8DQ10_9BACT|nr:MAG: hypothetical protein AUJ28_02460 [Parcubacteria group bacterium CG1_02_37_51]PIY94237.1 MAG: diacylglycerol kinase [Candidatus Komeilibacteria bacterium CG_4_10_14_0_8_um_filter_37_78]PJC01000.1 MAG: diacylglycerol kinase [Candidatus Komeilibacteria bacterium CG_4_9_14_0_8_um_filter_36_9]